jgi:5-methylcytosine-specific restriction endonuclease McrA
MKKSSKIWNIDKIRLQELLNNSSSIVEVLKKLGYNGYNGNYKTLLKRIKFDKLSLDELKKNTKEARSKFCKEKLGKIIPNELVFCKDSKYNSNKGLKSKLLKLNFQYTCAICENNGIWNDKLISLQLDHINGVSNDNRLENLRFLCPNCHSQTSTFSGKINKKLYMCPICGSDDFKGYGKKCLKCSKNQKLKSGSIAGRKLIKWPPLKEVLLLCSKFPKTKVAKIIGCSDNAIKKFLIRNSC